MVGGPSAYSGGMSDVRYKAMLALARRASEITKVLSEISRRQESPFREQSPYGIADMPTTSSELLIAYFFGTPNTRAEIAPFFSIPPRTNCPSGVDRIPRPSVRTS